MPTKWRSQNSREIIERQKELGLMYKVNQGSKRGPSIKITKMVPQWSTRIVWLTLNLKEEMEALLFFKINYICQM